MPKVIAPSLFEQHFTNGGDALNGGRIFIYEGGTTTPAATWTESDGATPNANPIILDSAGRRPGGIWLTAGSSYKFVLKTSAGVTLDTVDNVVVGTADGDGGASTYLLHFQYIGKPGDTQFMGGHKFRQAVTLGINFVGSTAANDTNPAASRTVTVKKNGTAVGTLVFGTGGTVTFATVGAATVSFASGDKATFWGPAGAADASWANIYGTIKGTT